MAVAAVYLQLSGVMLVAKGHRLLDIEVFTRYPGRPDKLGEQCDCEHYEQGCRKAA